MVIMSPALMKTGSGTQSGPLCALTHMQLYA
jgi:hypothetical protein